jgi:hypothetical protein
MYKFLESVSRGSRAFPSGEMDGRTETDRASLTVAFRTIATVTINGCQLYHSGGGGVHFQADNTCWVCVMSDFEPFFFADDKTFSRNKSPS